MEVEVSNINIITPDYGKGDDDFWINIQIDISEVGKPGAEVFTANVVSPTRLTKVLENNSVLLGKGLLISKSYNAKNLKKSLDNLVKGINANTWKEFVNEFSRYFQIL